MKKNIILATFFIFLISCSDRDIFENKTINFNGTKRKYIIFIPHNIEDFKNPSLLIMLHGRGSTAEYATGYNFNSKSKDLGFITVYPQGIDNNWDYNDTEKYSDVEYITHLIDTLSNKYNIKNDRIYIAGRSIGGFMAYKMALEIPQKLSAVAVVSGLLTEKINNSENKPLSILHIHAKDDNIVTFNGYKSHAFSVDKSVDFWKDINRSDSINKTIFNSFGIEGTSWESKHNTKKVHKYIYDSGGHNWLPFTEDFIIDFFYNNPQRDNNIAININNQKSSYIINTPITVNLNIKNNDKIESVIYTVNNKLLNSVTTSPFSFIWTPKKEGKYKIKAKAKLSNGDLIYSTTELDIIITKPIITGDMKVLSTYYAGEKYSPKKAFDNDISTKWYSSFRKDKQKITIDLQDITTLNAITIYWGKFYASSYTVDESLDGINWTTIYKEKKSDGELDYIDFKQVKTRYLRINNKHRQNKNEGYSIKEVYLH